MVMPQIYFSLWSSLPWIKTSPEAYFKHFILDGLLLLYTVFLRSALSYTCFLWHINLHSSSFTLFKRQIKSCSETMGHVALPFSCHQVIVCNFQRKKRKKVFSTQLGNKFLRHFMSYFKTFCCKSINSMFCCLYILRPQNNNNLWNRTYPS